jgi:hypothetical protein
MKKILLLLFLLSVILILAVTGCRLDLKDIFKEYADIGREKQEIIESLDTPEEPDRELFSKYFSLIKLEETTLLPISETCLECGFNKKENFEFIYTVFDMRTNEFVKRCTSYASSEGSDGMVMEALEWVFLSPGNYEYRIYVENTLIDTIPFEVISYTNYFKNKLGLE